MDLSALNATPICRAFRLSSCNCIEQLSRVSKLIQSEQFDSRQKYFAGFSSLANPNWKTPPEKLATRKRFYKKTHPNAEDLYRYCIDTSSLSENEF